MIDIDLRSLRYFLVLADERHFGRAARRLGIAQPALSQQMRRLERLVGYSLAVRRPRVTLTDAGVALERAARATVASASEAVDAARRAARGETGTLVVGFAASVLLTPLASAIPRFRDRYPGVRLDLRELSTAAQIDALRDGTIDLGVLREPTGTDDSLVLREVLEEPLVVALPPGHPRSRRRSLPLGALAEEPFVLFPRSVAPGLHARVLAFCHQAGFRPHVVQEALEWLTIVALVDAGVGVSIAPASFEKLRWGGVTFHRVRPASVRTVVSLGFRSGRASAPAERFIEVVRELARR